MLVEFSIIPIGSGSSIGDQLAKVLKIVDASGLSYKVNPMGTVIEGNWAEIMKLIKKCHDTVMRTEDRVYTTISIDDRKAFVMSLSTKDRQRLEKAIEFYNEVLLGSREKK